MTWLNNFGGLLTSGLAVLGNEKPRLTSRNIKVSWICRIGSMIYLFPSSRAKPRLQEVWRSEASTHLPSSQTSRPNPPQWLMNVEPMHKQNNINNNIDHISFSDSKSLMQIRGQQRQLFLALANILRQPASLQEWACVLKPDPRWVNAHDCW